MRLGAAERQAALERMGREHVDVLVIGGGITGAGVALDAATRGFKTALVERRDFASGTSSKSSKLVHGGLRYLQQREIRLVYEALAERQRLLNLAPHLVQPLPFLIPVFAVGKGGMAGAKALAKTMNAALRLYDLTGGARIGKLHKRLTRDETVAHMPGLRADRLASGFLYYDARTDDARLTWTIARTAIEHGAIAANYAPVIALTRAGGQVTGAQVRDEIGGAEHEVSASVVINATGVWSDEIRALDSGTHPGTIRPAKGVHVTVPAARLAVDVAAVLPVPKDRRSIFVIPWGDVVYIGTTDTDYQDSLDDPVCTAADVEYLLGAVNTWVTDPISPADVLGTWAGLRPLVADARSERTADLSRRHAVSVSESGVITVTGGKLTTYRRMAADATDTAARALGRRRSRSRTAKLPLIGAEGLATVQEPGAAAALGIDAAVLEHLTGRYGSHARAVLAMMRDDDALAAPLVGGLPYVRAEARYAVRYEMAMTLPDVLARRTRALLIDRAATAAAAADVAALIAPDLGWDAAETARQTDAFAELVERERAASAAARDAVTP